MCLIVMSGSSFITSSLILSNRGDFFFFMPLVINVLNDIKSNCIKLSSRSSSNSGRESAPRLGGNTLGKQVANEIMKYSLLGRLEPTHYFVFSVEGRKRLDF